MAEFYVHGCPQTMGGYFGQPVTENEKEAKTTKEAQQKQTPNNQSSVLY